MQKKKKNNSIPKKKKKNLKISKSLTRYVLVCKTLNWRNGMMEHFSSFETHFVQDFDHQ